MPRVGYIRVITSDSMHDDDIKVIAIYFFACRSSVFCSVQYSIVLLYVLTVLRTAGIMCRLHAYLPVECACRPMCVFFCVALSLQRLINVCGLVI